MDRYIAGYPAEPDGDLMLCQAHGVAYQRDMTALVSYDAAYFDKCAGYTDKEIGRKINAGRVALVNRHVGSKENVLDIGIGAGDFIRSRQNTFGTDVNPKALSWLETNKLRVDDLSVFRAFTFWDVIEHIEDPGIYFDKMQAGSFLFTCLPIFKDLSSIRESRHYRPGEHLYYWTMSGFISWMDDYGFEFRDMANFETDAGRDNITSFVFERTMLSAAAS